MCLKVLNISDNKIISLRDLIGFQELHILDAKNNLIDNVDDLIATISTLTSLKDLSLQGNPVTWSYRYKENLIANSISLGKVLQIILCYLLFMFITQLSVYLLYIQLISMEKL